MQKNKGAGGSYAQRVAHVLRFDESAGTLRFADKDGDWWEGIKLSFSESEITGRLKPGWIRSANVDYFANFSSSVGSVSEEIYSLQAVYFSYTSGMV